jgi:hypothetical protein
MKPHDQAMRLEWSLLASIGTVEPSREVKYSRLIYAFQPAYILIVTARSYSIFSVFVLRVDVFLNDCNSRALKLTKYTQLIYILSLAFQIMATVMVAFAETVHHRSKLSIIAHTPPYIGLRNGRTKFLNSRPLHQTFGTEYLTIHCITQ